MQIDGLNLAYTDNGEGEVVLLLHGFLENKSMWSQLIPHFKNFRLIGIDFPGHGNSDDSPSTSLDYFAELIEKILLKLTIHTKISIIGHSMGGYVALAYLARNPNNVNGICLYASSASADNELKKEDRLRAVKLMEDDLESFIRKAVPNLFAKENRKRKAIIDQATINALTTTKAGAVNCTLAMRNRPDNIELLKSSEIVKNYILGSEDPVLPQKRMLAELDKIGNASYEILDGVGHMAYLEDPENAILSIKRFLESI